MIHFKTITRIGLLAGAALLAACAQQPAQTMNQAAPTAEQLQAYVWDLRTAHDGAGQATQAWQLQGRKPLRLQFNARQLSVQQLCNIMNAGYRIDGTQLQVQRPMSTMRACAEDGLMQLEHRVGQQLPSARSAQLAQGGGAPVLTLGFADGSRWELAGTPTPQTRYGSAPERVFWEVAPDRVACSHGVVKDAQCLRVREIRYADNGVKQGAGPWELFYGQIEGWQHQDGVRNVLRLDRYRVKNPPADASSLAYVLDMVVESEQVKK